MQAHDDCTWSYVENLGEDKVSLMYHNTTPCNSIMTLPPADPMDLRDGDRCAGASNAVVEQGSIVYSQEYLKLQQN